MSRHIAEALVSIGGVGFAPHAPITFKSGIKSPVYCDNRKFPFHPHAWGKVIHGFQQLIYDQHLPADVIAGIEAAGIPHSAALGFAMQKPSIFVRKEAKSHGAKKRVEGGEIEGKQVILIEDLVSTGSSSLSGVEALRAEGGHVSHCLAIISYNMPEATSAFAAANVKLHALTSFAEILEVALHQGTLDQASADIVQDWLSEPHGWAERNGFE